MVRFEISYEGDLHCSLTHGPSGSVISTDAPVDNHGRGATFSPTDLCAASLGACMATVMGIEAQKRNLDLTGLQISVEKIMTNVPVRKIRKLIVELTMPRTYSEEDYTTLQHIAHTCPVKESLNPDIDIEIIWK
ncbi:MAG: OsmC family protein [Candidatus Kapabacteria bacterium]|nr:OsmC family protein [Candidatus Kapabacteria bacterium]